MPIKRQLLRSLIPGVFTLLVSTSADAAWLPAGNPLTTAPQDQVHATTVSDGSGGAFVSWEHDPGPHGLRVTRIRNTGAIADGWPTDGVGLGYYHDDPILVEDGTGGVIVIWATGNLAFDIHAQRVSASGEILWPAGPVPVSLAPDDQREIAAVPDGAGGAFVTWADQRNGGQDIYAQHIDASGERLWEADGRLICDVGGYQSLPSIVTDGTGGTIIAWTNWGEVSGIYAQHVTAAGAATWQANGALVSTPGGYKAGLAVCADGAGGVIAIWSDGRYNPTHIRGQRFSASGSVAAGWPADGLVLCPTAYEQGTPTIASDGAGGAIACWVDQRNGSKDVYAQRVRHDSQLVWGPAGVPVSKTVGPQQAVKCVADGRGGAIVTWEDGRSGSDYDVYVTRVDSVGVRLGETGFPLSAVAGNQRYPSICSDGDGTAIVAWEDARAILATGSDIYAGYVPATFAVAVEDAMVPGLSVHPAYPNPTRGHIDLTITFGSTADATLAVYAVSGRRLSTSTVRPTGLGPQRVRVQLPGDILPGVLFVEVVQGQASAKTKLVLTQ